MIKNLKFVEIAVFVLLGLFSVSFLNMGGYFLAAVLLFYLVVTFNGKLKIDDKGIILLLFSITYFVNYSLYWPISVKEIIVFLVAPWSVYLLGYYLVQNSKCNYVFNIMTTILALGLFVHGILNFLITISLYGFDMGHRISVDFWRKEFIAVTGCSLYYVPLMGLSMGYLFEEKNKILKILSFFAIVLGMIANIVYENRTAIYLLAILIVFGVSNKILKRRVFLNTWIKLVLIVSLILLALVFDFAGIRTFIFGLDVVDRIQGEDVGRFNVWLNFLSSDWWMFPFGGKQANFDHGFAHNLWLDVLHTVGYVPFILLVIFTVRAYSVIKRLKSSDSQNRKKYTYMILAMTISSFVEPVIDSNPYYFLILIMILGGMSSMTRKEEIESSAHCVN